MIEEKKWGDLIGDHRKARHFPNEMEELEKENPDSIKVRKETAKYVSQLLGSFQEPYIPALRFQEFLNQLGWEEKTLAEIAVIKRGNGLSKSSIIKDGKNACILYGELFTKYNTVINSVFSKTNETSTVTSKAGDILMPTSDVTPKGLAKASAISVDGVLLGGDMNIISPNSEDINSIFLAYSINYFSKKIIDKVSGSTVKHIYVSDLKDIPYEFPSLPEQQKIAEFFSTLDERIDLIADKVNLLKEQKQGYLQKIFNRELVFTDDNGNAYPEWEEKKLAEVANLVTGNTPPTDNASCWDGDYPWATPGDMGLKKYIHTTRRRVTKLGLEKSRPLPAGSLIVTCIGATIGKSAILAVEGSCNQQNNAILPSDSLSVEYIYYILETQIEKMKGLAGQTATPILNKTAFGQLVIPFPSLSEQEKIAELFSALDEQIELNENKLALLEKQKKGYLQGIFG